MVISLRFSINRLKAFVKELHIIEIFNLIRLSLEIQYKDRALLTFTFKYFYTICTDLRLQRDPKFILCDQELSIYNATGNPCLSTVALYNEMDIDQHIHFSNIG